MTRPDVGGLGAIDAPATAADLAGGSLADLPYVVTRLLRDAAGLVDDTHRQRVFQLAARLNEPLAIAVVGRTNAGKSTLVNALIGARVAPTRATECTKLITWYRYGPHQARVLRRDGAPVPLFTDHGRLPDDVGVPAEQVDRVEVWLSHAPLRDVTVIDTPGLSGDGGLAGQTEQLLASGAADVLVFVLGEALRADEVAIISGFRGADADRHDFPTDALGVLSRADQYGDVDTTWSAATARAAEHARTLSTGLAGVVPVMGKIAETTESGGFDEAQAAWLRTLAEKPDEVRADALVWADGFTESGLLPSQATQLLLDRLDMYGIRVLADTAAARDMSAAAMYERLRRISGIATLRNRLEVLFVRPAVVHKAVRALADLQCVLATAQLSAGDRTALLTRIETVRDHPDMHRLNELRALTALFSGRCVLPDELATANALALFEQTDPAARLRAAPDTTRSELARLARQATKHWHVRATLAATGLEKHIADTASWSAYLIHQQLREAP